MKHLSQITFRFRPLAFICLLCLERLTALFPRFSQVLLSNREHLRWDLRANRNQCIPSESVGVHYVVIAGWKKKVLKSKLHYFWVFFSLTFVFINSIFNTHLVISSCLFSEPVLLHLVSSISALRQSKLCDAIINQTTKQSCICSYRWTSLPVAPGEGSICSSAMCTHTSKNHLICFIWSCQQCCLPFESANFSLSRKKISWENKKSL